MQKKHIVFLGETGFPFGLASIQRLILMSKALLTEGFKVTTLCRKGVYDQNGHFDFATEGVFEGIHYKYTANSIFKPKHFLTRNLQKLKGMYREFKYLKYLKTNKSIDAVIVSSLSFLHVLLYRFYTWYLGIPLILNFVELASSMKHRRGFFTKVNDSMFDNLLIKTVDAALPISEALMEYYQKMSPTKPKLKLPILCDFDKFEMKENGNLNVKFLFCGDASYFDIIEFIIDSFELLTDKDKGINLELVLGGDRNALNAVQKRIERSPSKSGIQLITNVDHQEIPSYYAKATALLIPLRPIVQDEARFPHKIGEYLASGRPMITTLVGEIKHYDFVDQVTALIADLYSPEAFAQKMKFIIEHPQKAIEVGKKGRKMGKENFDYAVNGKKLKDFVKRINEDEE